MHLFELLEWMIHFSPPTFQLDAGDYDGMFYALITLSKILYFYFEHENLSLILFCREEKLKSRRLNSS